MGTVWRARDIALHREVAVKQVRPLAPEPASGGSGAVRVLRERVLREARALARLSHPHVVTIHHVIDEGEDSYPWLVMELVPGRSLAALLDEGTLAPEEAVRVGRQVLAALRAAHAAGIRHRDVKPANVMLRPDGDAVLTDFGIAALQRTGSVEGVGSASLTATGEVIGTPEYLAPERIRGTDDDPASDLWSLGMMLYVCVEGHNPLRRPTQLATVAAVLDGAVPPPVRAGALAPVLMALLVPDPAARPSAERLDAMLAAVAEGGGDSTVRLSEADRPTRTARVPAPGPEPVSPSAAPSRRRRTWLIAGAAIVAAVLIAVTAYTLGRDGGDGGKGGEAGSGDHRTSQSNKLKLVKPGTLTVAVSGVRSGSAHNLAGAAGDGGWIESGDTDVVGGKEGDWVGLDPDLAKALGDRLGLRVKVVGIEVFGPKNPFEPLGSQYDVVMPSSTYTSFDAKERESVDFLHYFDYGYTAYATWKTAQGIHSWADLCGMRVDSTDEEAVRAASYKECGPDPIKQTSWDAFETTARLRDGSIDAVVTDLPYAVREARDSNGAFHLAKGDLVKEAPIGLAVDKSNPALRDELRKALDALMDSGEYKRILTDWDLEDGAVPSARIIHG
ncbi:serine/threonine-protein kinase [Streptomyces sparsogenes]|uniref:serine/threonine-protein kinase n=1 Tax=Streptomyces sparsogenes TaxID=67365 RepID=UPI0033192208